MLGKAASLGDDVRRVVGSGVEELAAAAGRFGATKVYVADDAALAAPLPQPRVDALAQLVRDQGIDTVLFAARCSPRTSPPASRRGSTPAELGSRRPRARRDARRQAARARGHRLVDVGWTSEPRLALFRSGAFDPVETGGRPKSSRCASELAGLLHAARDGRAGARGVERAVDRGRRRDRGRRPRARRPESFALAEELAKALGGAVAATRAVVDAGWYPYATQVGQTGKTVSPEALRRVSDLRRDPAQGRDAGLGHRSSRSTRTRTRRSSTSATSASSATCTRSSRSSPSSSGSDRAHERAGPRPPATIRRRSRARGRRGADRSARRADRGRRPDRRRRPAGLACAIRLGQLLEE